MGDRVREPRRQKKSSQKAKRGSGLPARPVGRLYEIAPATYAVVMEDDLAVLRDLLGVVAVCPDVRAQRMSSFHRRYSLKAATTRFDFSKT
jgi:hypothetical protein